MILSEVLEIKLTEQKLEKLQLHRVGVFRGSFDWELKKRDPAFQQPGWDIHTWFAEFLWIFVVFRESCSSIRTTLSTLFVTAAAYSDCIDYCSSSRSILLMSPLRWIKKENGTHIDRGISPTRHSSRNPWLDGDMQRVRGSFFCYNLFVVRFFLSFSHQVEAMDSHIISVSFFLSNTQQEGNWNPSTARDCPCWRTEYLQEKRSSWNH